MDIKNLHSDVQDILFETAKHFGFDYYSIPHEEIDYKFFEDVPVEEIVVYLVEQLAKLQDEYFELKEIYKN